MTSSAFQPKIRSAAGFHSRTRLSRPTSTIAAGAPSIAARSRSSPDADLLLAPLPLGDVHAREQHAGFALAVAARRGRPGDDRRLAVLAQPACLQVRPWDAVRRRRDGHPHRVLVVRMDELQEAPARRLPARPAERLRERPVDSVLLDSCLGVDDDEEARDRGDDGLEEVPRLLDLRLAARALGHVHPGDEVERPLVETRERRARPGHEQPAARARHPVVVVLAELLARDDALDPVAYLVGVRRMGVPHPEHLPADVGRVPLERPLEGDVGPLVGQPSLLVDEAEEARRVVRDRVQERALALLLGLEAMPLGDVETPGDDAHDVAEVVHRRRSAPVDRAGLAPRVRERVLVLRGREVRRGLGEALDHGLALVVGDEHVPERASRDGVRGLVPGRLEGGVVDVPDPPFDVDVHEQARRRVRHRPDERDLGAKLRLEALVQEREPRSRRHRVDALALRVERHVVEQRRDLLAAPLHEPDGPRRGKAQDRERRDPDRPPTRHPSASRPGTRRRGSDRPARLQARCEWARHDRAPGAAPRRRSAPCAS